MDINSLLSPQESPSSATPPPLRSPHGSPSKRAGRPAATTRKSSTLSQQLTLSHHPVEHHSAPHYAHPNPFHAHLALPSPGLASANGRGYHSSATSTPTSLDGRPPFAPVSEPYMSPVQPPLHRQASTPGMDTLADLASMQHHHQTTRQNSVGLRDPQVYQAQRPSISLQNLPRTLSTSSAKDLPMADAPARSPRIYHVRSLSPEDNQALNDAAKAIAENSYDYQAHVTMIKLLRKGLVNYTTPSSPDAPPENPATYDYVVELRQARQTMEAKYPLGEEMWIEWLDDELALAQSIDDRLSLMENFSKAVQDEPSSSTLWRRYGEFMYGLWVNANEVDGAKSSWSEEDKTIGREVFTYEQMMDVWRQGVSATKWHMNDSHLVWDRYMEILFEDQTRAPSPIKVQQIRALFEERLLVPHATWDQTFQMFSTFISTHDNAAYEDIMASMTQRASKTKEQYSLRETFEFQIQRAVQNNDKDAEWTAYASYIRWERRKQGIFSFNPVNAVFERATTRFPTDATFWEDYVEFLIETPNSGVSTLAVLERATRHCPWAGALWSHRILALEQEGKDFVEIEGVKHHATSTGLLDQNSLEELLKVYIAWCGYLRRKAFSSHSSEDDLDIAEVGIRSALEHVRDVGNDKYGKEFKGDPLYRLERINIKFLTQSGNVEGARAIWQSLVKIQRDSYDFWYRYYIWEMLVWGQYITQNRASYGPEVPPPREATAVLRQGLKRIQTMDWPEQLITMFLNHCEQHESVQELRSANVEARKATKAVQKRREDEAAAAAENMQAYAAQPAEPSADAHANGAKRKWDGEAAEAEGTSKKSKHQDAAAPDDSAQAPAASESREQQFRRDREHSTIVVRGLPQGTTETKVRQFFRDCGTINSLKLVPESDTVTATVEFDTPEDAAYAQMRETKPFDGAEIKITMGTGTTLWVTNFPREADETYIRDLFKNFGEIVDVRFPSLALNTHRRFCYVQFLTEEQARAATSLDGTDLGRKNKLVAKISNPALKATRTGPLYEGRELFIRNLDFAVTETELRDKFAKYGEVESVRIPKNYVGRPRGIAYVVYKTKEQAEAAVAATHNTQIKSRVVHVGISKPDPIKRLANNVAHPAASANGESSSTADTAHTRFERTIALMNIPDTVNDTRIRLLAERVGPVNKVVLMPEHGGAIIEFAQMADVGRASLTLEGAEIANGKKLRIGTPEELKRMGKREWRSDRLGEKPKAEKKKAPPAKEEKVFTPAGVIHRPSQGGGRRGGLGSRGRGGFGGARAHVGATSAAAPTATMGEERQAEGKPRSNEEFRALFVRREGDVDMKE